MHPNPVTVGAWFLRKMHLQLYAYPVTYFFSEVTDYPYIVGNSQIFDRMLYLWGFRDTKLRFGISVNGLFGG